MGRTGGRRVAIVAQDPYKVLGVARGASDDEIRKAFRKLAKELHPDRNPGDKPAEERFKQVSAAFDILGDPDKRKKFDRGEIDADGRDTMRGFHPGGGGFGGGGFGQGGFGQGGFGQHGFGQGGFGQNAGAQGFDFDDIVSEMFSGRGSAGFGGGARGFSHKGADVRFRLDVDLEDAIRGGSKRISLPDGRILDVNIPKGAHAGQTLRLRGQGQPGRNGGPQGDALIEIDIRAHGLYRQEGADLYMDLPVSLPDAILGAKVEAPTPDGTVALSVPRHANSGQQLRLKGKGAVDPATGKRGDLIAKLIIALPDPPDPELDRFAEDMRAKRPYVAKRKG